MTEKTGQKQRGGFKPGQSGNPAGRPKGARNRTTVAVEALLEGQAERLTQKAIDRAIEGDSAALKLCLDRLVPPRRDRLTPFDLPVLKEAADARNAFAAIIAAAADGALTPGEATTLAKLVSEFVTVDGAITRPGWREKNGVGMSGQLIIKIGEEFKDL